MTRFQLLNQIILHEGTGPIERGRMMPYTDTKGLLSIGYGRNLHANGVRVSEARTMLENDVAEAEAECRTSLPYFADLDPVRQAVVIELVYNMGLPTWNEFVNTQRAIERGNFKAAADGLRHSAWYRQVGKRRGERLATLMEKGVW